jgi:hypothetical protein
VETTMETEVSTKANEFPAHAPAPFSGEHLLKVLELLKGSTTFEAKVVVPDWSHRAAIKGLGFDPVDVVPRQIYFFDTPELALNKAGIIIRARRFSGGRGDTVVKLRPVDPVLVDPELRHSKSFKIELDVMPGGYICSASFKGVSTSAEVLEVVEGRKSIALIFSKGQRAFFKVHAPAHFDVDKMVPMGPVFILRHKYAHGDFRQPITVELWLYPDGSRIFEVSTKGPPTEAFQVAAEFRAFVTKCGIPLEKPTVTKTGSAIKFFGKEFDA